MKASRFAPSQTQQLHKVTVRDSRVKSLQGWGGFPGHGLAGWLPHMLIALACLSAAGFLEGLPKQPLSKEEWTPSKRKANRILLPGEEKLGGYRMAKSFRRMLVCISQFTKRRN